MCNKSTTGVHTQLLMLFNLGGRVGPNPVEKRCVQQDVEPETRNHFVILDLHQERDSRFTADWENCQMDGEGQYTDQKCRFWKLHLYVFQLIVISEIHRQHEATF